MGRFEEKKAIVTGAGMGIGFEIARRLANEGATVGLNDLDPNLAAEAAGKINDETGRAAAIACPSDIADVAGTTAAIDRFAEQAGGIDVMVANAGITVGGPFMDFKEADFDRLCQVNLRGTYFSVQAAAKHIIAGGRGGSIVMMSSVTGVQAHLDFSAYGMTKAAIRILAKTLAVELGPHRITANAIGAGATLTPRTLASHPDYEAEWSSVASNQSAAETGDIAEAAMYLASEAGRHVTGHTLMVDGGWTTRSPLPPYLQDNA